MNQRRLLMGVFNSIEHDGRVQRAAEALSVDYEVTLCCTGTGPAPENISYRVIRSRVGGRLSAHVYFWRLFLSTARQLQPDIVYAHDFFLPAVGYIASRLTRASLIYDAHELYVPEPEVSFSFRSRFFYELERHTIRKARTVIAANPERAAVMQHIFKLQKMPVVVRNIPPLPSRRYSSELLHMKYPALACLNPQAIRVLYQGDVSYERGLHTFMEALRLLPERYQLIVVGGGPNQQDVSAAVHEARYGTNRLVWLGKIPRADLFDVMSVCDIGVITYPMTGQNQLLCAPNKIYEYAQAGLPVVATAQPTLRDILRQDPIGELIEDSGGAFPTSHAIARAISTVAGNLESYQQTLPVFLSKNRWECEAETLRHAVASALVA